MKDVPADHLGPTGGDGCTTITNDRPAPTGRNGNQTT